MTKKRGPPLKPINWELFEQLCAIQCTQYEIASMLKVHPNTLSDRTNEYFREDYSTVYKKLSECGKCSLRRYQFNLSKTNASMAIFLDKNWLGQTDGRENVMPPTDKSVSSDLEYIKKIGELLTRIKELERQLGTPSCA